MLAVSILLAAPVGSASALVDGGGLGNILIDGASALEVGESLAAPEELEAAAPVLGAACATGVGCAIVGTVLVGGALYMTKDKWLPVVQGALSSAFSSDTGTGKSAPDSLCGLSAGGTLNGSAVVVTGTYTTGCTSTYSTKTLTLMYSQAQCVDASGNALGSALSGTWSMSPTTYTSGASVSHAFDICGSGATVAYAQVQAKYLRYTSTYWTDQIALGAPLPASALSQVATSTCKLPDGTTQTVTLSEQGAPGGDSALLVPSCQQRYPGSVPTDYTVSAGIAGHEQPLVHQTLTDPRTQYPDCFDASGAFTRACVVKVWINGQPCTTGMDGCNNPGVYGQDNPSATVECRWGSYVIGWANCAPLKHHYAGKTQLVDGVDPSTGQPNLDPDAGTSAPAPAQSTIPQTGTNPAAPDTSPDGGTNPDTQSCWGQGWSWNPVSWVYVPTKCAMLWAFKPDPSAYDWQGFVDQVKARPPTSIVFGLGDLVQGIADGFSGAGDCGIIADFTTPSDATQQKLQVTCAEVEAVPGFGVLYALVSTGIVGVTVFGMFKLIQRSLGGQ